MPTNEFTTTRRHYWRRRFVLPSLFLVFVGLFLGCGGGGGGGETPLPTVDLGELSSTVPSSLGRTFINPLGGLAEVTAIPATGPLSFDAATLPTNAPGSGPVNLRLRFEPDGPGEVTSVLGLRFSSGSDTVERYYEVTATGETVPWIVGSEPGDPGDVLPGESATFDLRFTNGSTRSPVTLTSAIVPFGYRLDPDPFPLTVLPGHQAAVTVVYAPPVVGSYGGLLRLGPDDTGGPVDFVLVGASTGAGERVIDLGTQDLTNGETPELSVEVPANAISIGIEGVGSTNDEIGLLMFEGPNGKVYENVTATGPVKWTEAREVFFTHIPSSDGGDTQLVNGGGTYKFKLYRLSGVGSTMDVRVHLELRTPTTGTDAILPLNVFLADGLTPNAAGAANDTNLQAVFADVSQILGAQGITLGDIHYYDITDPKYDRISQGEEASLFPLSGVAQETRLNLFLVKSVWDGNLLGYSGAIDGAKRKGEPVTGVVSFYFDAQPGAIAIIVAHEICHYLGLWHTVEGDGTYDEISDTPECPVTGTSGACPEPGGDLLMHWEAIGGRVFTAGQAHVVRGHPLLHPTGQTNTLRAQPLVWEPDAETLEFFRHAPRAWCGTHR